MAQRPVSRDRNSELIAESNERPYLNYWACLKDIYDSEQLKDQLQGRVGCILSWRKTLEGAGWTFGNSWSPESVKPPPTPPPTPAELGESRPTTEELALWKWEVDAIRFGHESVGVPAGEGHTERLCDIATRLLALVEGAEGECHALRLEVASFRILAAPYSDGRSSDPLHDALVTLARVTAECQVWRDIAENLPERLYVTCPKCGNDERKRIQCIQCTSRGIVQETQEAVNRREARMRLATLTPRPAPGPGDARNAEEMPDAPTP